MKIVQLIKQLNNTELGKGGTHDTYVLVPNELDITPIFEQPDVVYEFTDPLSSEKVKVRNTVGREKRIVGLGSTIETRNYLQEIRLFLKDELMANGTVFSLAQ